MSIEMTETARVRSRDTAARAVPTVPPATELERIFVDRIRPEEGLGRKRDREGHLELQRSIELFGVLTPITVRRAPDDSGDYLLIKGQGRTLACRFLGIETIPAIVVDEAYAEREKVPQFLVENVARLKMNPVDRALLIHHARLAGEETASIAKRFGIAPTTVRRLLAQLEGATPHEVSALRQGHVSLTLHAVVARHVQVHERSDVIAALQHNSIRPRELDSLFQAIGWGRIAALSPESARDRLLLLAWSLSVLADLPPGDTVSRFEALAARLPADFEADGSLGLDVR